MKKKVKQISCCVSKERYEAAQNKQRKRKKKSLSCLSALRGCVEQVLSVKIQVVPQVL
jgi:hypothetical protein